MPSHAALVQQFPDVADSILSASRGNAADTGLFDRLVNSARSVIKVRPTGNVPGNSPPAIVARMETKLKAGNLKGVVDEWSSLPPSRAEGIAVVHRPGEEAHDRPAGRRQRAAGRDVIDRETGLRAQDQ